MTETDTPRPNLRVQAKARTRDKVMVAARAIFDEKGYAAATIRDIAKSIGMSTGAIFASFKDKAALYQALYGHKPLTEETARRALIILRAVTIDDEPADESGRDLVDEVLGFDLALVEARELLHQTGVAALSFNALAESQGQDPDEMIYADAVRVALETPL